MKDMGKPEPHANVFQELAKTKIDPDLVDRFMKTTKRDGDWPTYSSQSRGDGYVIILSHQGRVQPILDSKNMELIVGTIELATQIVHALNTAYSFGCTQQRPTTRL
jgi:hypothetical protein